MSEHHTITQRIHKIAKLRERFTAVNLRSRSLRLTRCTSSGAFDLQRLRQHAPDALAALIELLGHSDEGSVALIDQRPTDVEARSIAADLATLHQNARSDWQETGLRDLAIGWPLLEGRTADGSWLRAPLLLYPVWLEPTTSGRLRWMLHIENQPQLNASLALTLRRLAGAALTLEAILEEDDDKILAIDAPTLRGFHQCLAGLGLTLTHTPEDDVPLPRLGPIRVRLKAARDKAEPGLFRLHHQMVLGRFPPSGSAVVGDYDELLADDPTDARLGCAADLIAIDDALPPSSPPAPAAHEPHAHWEARRWLALPSDSSQDAVLRWLGSGHGRGLVVQGPPGTGKSQMIANLVTSAVASGLRALVVCEKRAAIDVVAARLAERGLGEPLAVVHDAAGDRNAVCRKIASSIDAINRLDQPGADARAVEAAANRVATRLALTSDAFDAMAVHKSGRPSLAALLERAIDEPDAPLPDLAPVIDGITTHALGAALPRLAALSAETRALPLPLACRDDLSGVTDDGLDAHERAIDAAHRHLLALSVRGATRTVKAALADAHLWEEASIVLDLFDDPDSAELDRFLLFWTWTGGAATHGTWREVMRRLERARNELHPIPWELITEPGAQLEAWRTQLVELATLDSRWYRAMLPRWWKLRHLPEDILGRCLSMHAQTTALAPVSAETPRTRRQTTIANVNRLIAQAQAWIALIEDLPGDNPFLDFGFQGGEGEIEAAILEIRAQHDRVRAIHRLLEAIDAQSGPYSAIPDLDGFGDPEHDPFIKAALSDYRLIKRARGLADHLESARAHLDGGVVEQLQRYAADAAAGHVERAAAGARALLDAWSEAPEARRLNRLTAKDPRWVRHFLKHWRPAPPLEDPERAAQVAVERAWRAAIRDGRSRKALEAPLLDAGLLESLARDEARLRDVAATGVVAVYRDRLRAINADPATSRTLRQLAAQARKQRRRMTLRQLVAGYWSVLGAVRPVWMCSPGAVASLFPLEPGLFDLVIFDEASQCPVEAGLPVILRGDRVIVAGDGQQMPPSRFFQSSHGVDTLDQEEDTLMASTSLLDLAQVAWPAITLSWHYRSRFEALVAFSNAAFYGGALITAPRAGEDEQRAAPLVFQPVEGALWESGVNAVEAEAVVDVVRSLLTRADRPSIGVVAFSLSQADAISAAIYERSLVDEPLRAARARDSTRPPTDQLFVRNLENVQGDERDVIVFSIGYAPTEPGGRVHARFGPLGQLGGEKRLNVAVTRARRQLIAVCSFDPAQLDVSRSRRAGPPLFKTWLELVKATSEGREDDVRTLLHRAATLGNTPDAAHIKETTLTTGARVRDALAEALRQRGVEVHTNHGLGRKRIDLALATPGQPPTLGVDCTDYLKEPDALTRDLYDVTYWRLQGWNILRVSFGDFREDPDAVVASILDALDRR